jgi:hypothetical protein
MNIYRVAALEKKDFYKYNRAGIQKHHQGLAEWFKW